MKTIKFIVALLLTLPLSNNVLAMVSDNNLSNESSRKIVTVNSAKFSSPLINKWIQEFNLSHPEIEISVVNNTNADLQFVMEGQNEVDSDLNQNIAYVGRYALLPVTSADNPLLSELMKKELDEKGLKKLFFQNELQDETTGKKNILNDEITVYSGSGRSSGAVAFAKHFGRDYAQLRGKRIAGDDAYLLTAIAKDPKSITFNNLSYLFDTNSRKLKQKVALLPLDVKKDQKTIFNSGDLDQTLDLLETSNINLVPQPRIGFAYQKNEWALIFLRWIIDKGQQFNHDFGFLTLTPELAQQELRQLDTRLLTNR